MAMTLALAPLHAATAALCVEGAPPPSSASDRCCPGGAGERPEEAGVAVPIDDPCEGCDCSLACCIVQGTAPAPLVEAATAAMGSRSIESGVTADDGAPPDRRPGGVRRPPRLGFLR